MNEHIITVEDHVGGQRHAMHDQEQVTEVCAFYPSPQEWGNSVDNLEFFDSGWSGHGRLGFVQRHRIVIALTVIGGLLFVSALLPSVTHVLNIIMLIAVIVAAVVFVVLFTYLIGTTVRSALRVRRGGSL
jgi:uncharacterized membrane protein YesL